MSCNRGFNANLINVDLSGLDLSGANLSNANLTGANLNSTKLCNANLLGAILYDSSLIRTNLTGADLTGAVFIDAYLEDIELEDVSLKGTVFSKEQIDYLEKDYDIHRDRIISRKTIERMKSLEKEPKLLTMGQIDALLNSMSSGDSDSCIEVREGVLMQKEIDMIFERVSEREKDLSW